MLLRSLSKCFPRTFMLVAFCAFAVADICAQTGPVFSVKTPVSGIVGDKFIVVLPIENTGAGAADNVSVNSAAFGTIATVEPSLPIPLGPWPAASPKQLVLQFPGSNLVLGKLYLLTIRGTYDFGSTQLGFSVNRFIQVTTADSSTQASIQLWVALDAIRQESESVNGLGQPGAANAMLAFLQSRPEFSSAEISADSTAVWANVGDGLQVIVSFNSFSLPDLVNASTISESVSIVSNVPEISSAIKLARASSVASGTAPTQKSDGEMPTSSKFRFLNAFPNFSDGVLLPALTSWLSSEGYTPVNGAASSVAGLKAMNGQNDGVFLIRTHGEIVGQGTTDDPLVFALWTSDVTETSSFASFYDDATATPPRLKFYSAQIAPNVFETHWAITPAFVNMYWKAGTFSNNSLVYIDACKSDVDPNWKNAIMAAGASVYAGWLDDTGDPFAGKTARLAFDRMLGANRYCPETSPNVAVTPCAVGQAASPIFPQRPFNYAAVSNTEFARHALGTYLNLTSGFSTTLNFTPPTPGPTFGLLAPSIMNMQVDETVGNAGQLTIFGSFGTDPRTAGTGSVQIGGNDANIASWDPAGIVVNLDPNSSGDVQVRVRGHQSNVAQLTMWQGQFNFQLSGPQSISETTTYNLNIRQDIRQYRKVIHDPPGEPVSSFLTVMPTSTVNYSCGGSDVQTVSPQVVDTDTWSGSGTGTPVYTKLNLGPFFYVEGRLLDSMNIQLIDISPLGDTAACPIQIVLEDPPRAPVTINSTGVDYGVGMFLPINLSLDGSATILAPPSTFLTTFPFAEPVDATLGQATFHWNNITPTSPPDLNSAR
jgi:hypothetical protein